MRTRKIGLRHYLFSRKVPNVNDPRCACRRNDQTVRHILQECPLYPKLRNETWAEDEKKEPGRVNRMEENAVTPALRTEGGFVLCRKPGFLGQI